MTIIFGVHTLKIHLFHYQFKTVLKEKKPRHNSPLPPIHYESHERKGKNHLQNMKGKRTRYDTFFMTCNKFATKPLIS